MIQAEDIITTITITIRITIMITIQMITITITIIKKFNSTSLQIV